MYVVLEKDGLRLSPLWHMNKIDLVRRILFAIRHRLLVGFRFGFGCCFFQTVNSLTDCVLVVCAFGE